jgi:hypothetical protein
MCGSSSSCSRGAAGVRTARLSAPGAELPHARRLRCDRGKPGGRPRLSARGLVACGGRAPATLPRVSWRCSCSSSGLARPWQLAQSVLGAATCGLVLAGRAPLASRAGRWQPRSSAHCIRRSCCTPRVLLTETLYILLLLLFIHAAVTERWSRRGGGSARSAREERPRCCTWPSSRPLFMRASVRSLLRAATIAVLVVLPWAGGTPGSMARHISSRDRGRNLHQGCSSRVAWAGRRRSASSTREATGAVERPATGRIAWTGDVTVDDAARRPGGARVDRPASRRRDSAVGPKPPAHLVSRPQRRAWHCTRVVHGMLL